MLLSRGNLQAITLYWLFYAVNKFMVFKSNYSRLLFNLNVLWQEKEKYRAEGPNVNVNLPKLTI